MPDQPAQALLRVLNASITALPWTLQDAEDLIAELAAVDYVIVNMPPQQGALRNPSSEGSV